MPVRLVKRIGVILTYDRSNASDGNGRKKRQKKQNDFASAISRILSRISPPKQEDEVLIEGGRKDAKEK